MTRLSILLLVSITLSCLSLSHAQTTTTTGGDCTLKKLSMTSSLDFYPQFSPAVREYFCNCLFASSTTELTTEPNDPMATVTIQLNKNAANRLAHGVYKSNYNLNVGLNTFQISVACANCQLKYNISCTRQPEKNPQIIGDPMFSGLSGQNYQVHGVAGEIYNIISSPQLQVNSRFVFLNAGKCPKTKTGQKAKGCWSHPGSYLGEMGLLTRSGHKILVEAGDAMEGFKTVNIQDQAVQIGQTVFIPGSEDGEDSITYVDSHLVHVRVFPFEFEFQAQDHFINQQLTILDMHVLQSGRTHGLLGQTWNKKTYTGTVKAIEGEVDDYVIVDHDMFGSNFHYNRFHTQL